MELCCEGGFCILGNQLGLNAVAGFGAISGPMICGWLVARHLPLQRLFLAPVAPLIVGAVASFVLMRICFKLFGGGIWKRKRGL
jgi:hypothetical protein